jgi:ferredoxin-nitrite reductase
MTCTSPLKRDVLSVPLDVFLRPEEAVEACLAIIELFRDNGSRGKRNKIRLKFLLKRWGVDRFREELQRKLGTGLERAAHEPEVVEHAHLGIHPQKQEGLSYAGLLVPVGRLKAAQAMELCRLAEEYGSGELRLTHQQNVIIPGIPAEGLEDFKKESILTDLPLEPSPLMRNLVACTGNDYCTFALVESKGRALKLARYLEDRLPLEEPLRIHFSGCPNSCGQHQVADIGLQGTRVRIDGRLTEAVNIFLGGRLGKDACLGEQVMKKVPWAEAPGVIEGLLKAHRRKLESVPCARR